MKDIHSVIMPLILYDAGYLNLDYTLRGDFGEDFKKLLTKPRKYKVGLFVTNANIGLKTNTLIKGNAEDIKINKN